MDILAKRNHSQSYIDLATRCSCTKSIDGSKDLQKISAHYYSVSWDWDLHIWLPPSLSDATT
jgi:hypothetical protein